MGPVAATPAQQIRERFQKLSRKEETMSSRASAMMWQAGAEGIDALGRSVLAAQELQRQRDRQAKNDEMTAAEHVLRMLKEGAVRTEDLLPSNPRAPATTSSGGIGMQDQPVNPGEALLQRLRDPGTAEPNALAGPADVGPAARSTPLVSSPREALQRTIAGRSADPTPPDTRGYVEVAPGFFFPTASTSARQSAAAKEAQVDDLTSRLRAAHPTMTEAEARLQASAAVGKLSLPSYQPATLGEEMDEYGRKQGIDDTYDAKRQERGGVITRANQVNAHTLSESTRATEQGQKEIGSFAVYLAQQYPASSPADVTRWLSRKYPDADAESLAGYAGAAIHTRDGVRSTSAGGIRAKLDRLHATGAAGPASAGAPPAGLDSGEIAQARELVGHLPAAQKASKLEAAGYGPDEIRVILGRE